MMTWVEPLRWPRPLSPLLLLLLVALVGRASSSEESLEFTSEPSSRLVKPSEGRATFRCGAFPPAAQLRWLHGGQPLRPGHRWAKASGHRLTVQLAAQQGELQAGDFQCEARLRGLALLSAPAKLVVAVLEQFPAKVDVHIAVVEGNTAVIPCDPPYSVPTVVTEFLFDNTTIDKSTDNLKLMPSGDLQIFNAKPQDSGAYECVAYNPFLGEKVQAKRKVILHVEEPKESQPPMFIKSPRARLSVALGSNITLECVVNGYPVPSITWRRQHGQLPKLRNQQIGGNLHIFGVRRADEGLYYCETNNSAGSFISTSTAVDVQETPQIVKKPKSLFVEVGQNFTLNCVIRGHPKPLLTWIHNGKSITPETESKSKGSLLLIQNASIKHSGYYQCFASNDLGTAYATALVTVMSDNKSLDYDYGLKEDEDYDDGGISTPSFHRRKENGYFNKDHGNENQNPESHKEFSHDFDGSFIKRTHKKKKSKGVKLVPPSRPEVSRLSDTSVMVRWGVPRNDGLPILFFKVQYREVGRRSSHWMTIDEDIAAHIHSYAVTSLRTGGKYRFRIAAVYSNNDNKLGPNSAKYILSKDPQMKKPAAGPLITHAVAASPSAITLYWEYDDIDSVPIEGFFIYYRSTHTAGDYLKVTVLGANTRSHIISHLLPDNSYDIKMQCFNAAGTSDFSNIHACKTKPSEVMSGTRNRNKYEDDMPISITEPVSSKNADGNFVLYVVLGVVSGVLLIAVTVFLTLFNRQKHNRHERTSDDSDGESPIKIGNGHITSNGCYIPAKMSISVNPLSHLDVDDSDKPEEFEAMVCNNNEIRLQTFSIINEPQQGPLLSSIESCLDEEEPNNTVILLSDSGQATRSPTNL